MTKLDDALDAILAGEPDRDDWTALVVAAARLGHAMAEFDNAYRRYVAANPPPPGGWPARNAGLRSQPSRRNVNPVTNNIDDGRTEPVTVDVEDQTTPAEDVQAPDSAFTGSVLIQLIDSDGNIKDERRGGNLITDAGDLYYAGMAIALVTPAAPAQPTKMTGMKLGTGTTAAAKSGAGAALVTYLAASNKAFDATFPVTQNLGAGLGVNGQYKTTWGAGVATNSAITEAVIVNDAGTDATTTAANTSHRIVFTAINKGASDTLVITWNAKFLGV